MQRLWRWWSLKRLWPRRRFQFIQFQPTGRVIFMFRSILLGNHAWVAKRMMAPAVLVKFNALPANWAQIQLDTSVEARMTCLARENQIGVSTEVVGNKNRGRWIWCWIVLCCQVILPMSVSVATCWLRELICQRFLVGDLCHFGSHSCKTSVLTWTARCTSFTVSAAEWHLLGHHLDPAMKSVIVCRSIFFNVFADMPKRSNLGFSFVKFQGG